MSQRFRNLAIGSAVAFFVLIVAAAVVWQLTWSAPAWYSPPGAAEPAIVELADRVEYRLIQEAQQVRPVQDRTWTLRIQEDHVNAWLAARLPKWIAHQEQTKWPEQLGAPQVHFEPGEIAIALPLRHERRDRFVVARIQPRLADGTLHLYMARVQLGRVSLPGEPLGNFLETIADAAPESLQWPQIQTAVQWFRQRDSIDPLLKLSDGRRIRVINLQIRHREIDVTLRTLEDNEE